MIISKYVFIVRETGQFIVRYEQNYFWINDQHTAGYNNIFSFGNLLQPVHIDDVNKLIDMCVNVENILNLTIPKYIKSKC